MGLRPDDDTVVSDLKALHDLGVSIGPIGLLGAVVGAGIWLATFLRGRLGLSVAIAAAILLVAGGLYVVAKPIGL